VVYRVLVSVVSFCCIMGALRNPSAPIPHDSLRIFRGNCPFGNFKGRYAGRIGRQDWKSLIFCPFREVPLSHPRVNPTTGEFFNFFLFCSKVAWLRGPGEKSCFRFGVYTLVWKGHFLNHGKNLKISNFTCVSSLLAATLYQGNHNRNQKLGNIV
jgi:hypothetical protein